MNQEHGRKRLEVTDIGEVTVVTFADRKILDTESIRVIGEALFSLVRERGRTKILLNFSNVEYLGSEALGKFILLHKIVKNAGGRLVLCSLDPEIFLVFETTMVNRIFGQDNFANDEIGGLEIFAKP